MTSEQLTAEVIKTFEQLKIAAEAIPGTQTQLLSLAWQIVERAHRDGDPSMATAANAK